MDNKHSESISSPSATPTPTIISAPPSQLHSPSLSRSPLLSSPNITEISNGRKSPKTIKHRSPRFSFSSMSPKDSPLVKALQLTKLDPRDAWLPITESRNGNAYYAAFHVLCSGIGIQALVLPLAFTRLGWAWGILLLALAFIWQLYTLYLLVQLHESPETRLRYSRYLQLCAATFGDKITNWVGAFPVMYLSAGTCVALIIIGGSSSQILYQTLCGSTCSSNPLTTTHWFLVFTTAAVVLSQLPNLNSIAGVSLVGALTAIGYCTLIWVVSVVKGKLPGVTYDPVQGSSNVDTFFNDLNAIGIIVFAFRGHNLILEIQGTMPSDEKHPSHVPMWKGVKAAYLVIAFCLLPLAIGGYWAYGQKIPQNGGMLTALYAIHGRDTAPSILGLTSSFVIINAVSSFQIYSMPLFDSFESQYTKTMKKPCPWWARLISRMGHGYFCFFMAVAFPFLGSLAGLIGGIALPVTLAYPCFLWLKVKKPNVLSPKWWLNWVLGVSGMVLSGLMVAAGLYVVIATGIRVSFFNPRVEV